MFNKKFMGFIHTFPIVLIPHVGYPVHGFVKDELGLRTPGVYWIPYVCGMSCIGQTGHSVVDRQGLAKLLTWGE